MPKKIEETNKSPVKPTPVPPMTETETQQDRSMALLFCICILGTVSTLVITYLFFKKKIFADLIQIVIGEEQTAADVNELSLSLNLNLNFDKTAKQNLTNTLAAATGTANNSGKAHSHKPSTASRKG